MNSQNNNENSNNTDTADKDIYSNSNKQPSQTGESVASNDEKGNVQYADRSIRDDINDYKFVKSYKSHGHHKHHHHHHSSKENSDDVLLVQSSRPAKGSSNKIKKKSAKLLLFSENISTFAMCDLRYYDYGARLKRTQKELLNLK